MEQTGMSRRHLLAGVGSLLSASVAGCVLQAPEEIPSTESESTDRNLGEFPETSDTPEGTIEKPSTEGAQSEVYDAVIDSVAGVEIQTPQGPAGGTAWVYNDSYLVTNEHVVSFDVPPYVRFPDAGWREASVVGTDIHSDLAVIEVTNKPENATPLPLVEEPQAVGTPVAAVGNPFNLAGSLTTGVISGLDRNIRPRGQPYSIADGIQFDAAVNPGNSGGPLVTYGGDVVGVVSAGQRQAQNIGFAISAAMVQNVVPALIADGEYEHSHMGIQLYDVRPPIIKANDLPVTWGVYIDDTLPGGPSDGILEGTTETQSVDGRDVPVGGDVIVRMGDWAIPSQERLSAFLALETDPGDTIEIEIIRNAERETISLTLGARPDDNDTTP
ncbi:S1C family serine protease [Halovenus rubra]|uniref:S1C family serine protease n=2 Tax=Halovenus rubra TaxID=869890 RepID=A0ABD5X452_9EURY|nr:trypsin-like peptidase domain-containing protein [Halovenus rubra]